VGNAEMLWVLTGEPLNICQEALTREIAAEELSRLPEKHAARENPDLTFNRAVIEYTDFDKPLNRLENRVELIFGETL
jgi:hypothetical protein